MLRPLDVEQLACPGCLARLDFEGATREGLLEHGRMTCRGCKAVWPVEDGLARLYREEQVRGNDRLLRYIYDGLPVLHDPAVRYTMALFDVTSEDGLRSAYMPRLELESLKPREDGRPLRILEVGIGGGANLARVRRALPPSLPVEIWGVDLSRGMLNVLRRRLRHTGDRELRLAMTDAHALPFPDGAFDRVFHVGALNSYRDPAAALREMARVAAPGTPIVAVDEQLDPNARHGLHHRLVFRLVTFYDRDPHCPVEHLPAGAHDVQVDQLSRYFYCLRFRMPSTAR